MAIESSVINLVRPFPRLTAQVVILTTIASLMEGATLSLAIPLLQGLTESSVTQQESAKGFLVESLTNLFNHFPVEYRLTVILTCLLVIIILKGVIRFWADFSLRILQLKVGLRLRSVCINRFLNLGLSYYSRARGGDLLSYVNEHTQCCERLTFFIGSFLRQVLIIASFLILLMNISGKLTFFTCILMLGLIVGLKRIITRIRHSGNIVAQNISEFSSRAAELINGIRIIKSFGAEKYEKKRIDDILRERFQMEKSAAAGESTIVPLNETFGVIVLIIIMFLGSKIFMKDLVLPLILTFLLVLTRMFPNLNQLNLIRAGLATFRGSFDSIELFLEQTKDPEITDGSKTFPGLQREICLEDLTFTYADNEVPVLHNINLKLSKGTVTALVGTSGSGKSTLGNLLLRFYDPQAGRITIDKVDIKEFNLHSLRQSMAVVSQETFLFNATVRENIQYGNPDASEEAVMEAARQSYGEDFIKNLPQGFDTMIGDRGTRLSGGQQQRLAIARAILRDPEILILDEATSALDSNSEKIVQKALDEVGQNRTVLVIAHRLSTIRHADQIVVLEQGEIVELGTHEELLASEGLYYKLNLDQGLGNIAW